MMMRSEEEEEGEGAGVRRMEASVVERNATRERGSQSMMIRGLGRVRVACPPAHTPATGGKLGRTLATGRNQPGP